MAPTRKTNPKRSFGGPKKKSADAGDTQATVKGQSQALPASIDNDVPDFPRGGGCKLSKREREEIRAEVDAQFDGEGGEFKGGKRRKNMAGAGMRRKAAAEDELGSLFGDGIKGKLPRFANKITLKNISPGMKLWGIVAEVNEKDLAVSLPGGLRGLVRADDAVDAAILGGIKDGGNDFLSGIFHIGQLVSCIVSQVEDDMKESHKKRVWVSLCLSLLHKGLTLDTVQQGMVLTAYVRSIEDHGYILYFGLSSFTGFMPKKSLEGSREIKMNIGQLIEGVVRRIDKDRKVVHMSWDADTTSKFVTTDLKGISLDLLVPGMMVSARVQAALENGIMLSFLTYFTGTVDIFHLQEMFPSVDWKKKYDKSKKVNARILFVDPLTRAVGLTMNPHLILNKAPPLAVKTGDIFDQSKIIRIDKGSGILLEVPSAPVATPAYVTVADAADEDVKKLEKKFKEGSSVRARILGFKHLEGLAMAVLKASAFESSVFTHSDVKPGMIVKGKIINVKTVGAYVQFPSGVKALCPLQHMSEFEIAKPRKKFKVGAELVFRVLGCKSKRITVTHKKTLVKSKHPIVASYAEATDGLITHGWISKLEKHGCFVKFYNGVQGFGPRAELGLERGSDPSSMYHVGQVVKCRVTSALPAHHRINLSFIISPTRMSGDEMVKMGSLVSGVVEHVTPRSVLLYVNTKGNMRGTIFTEHLADHQGHAARIKSVLKPGHQFSDLLVLDVEGNNLILSAKRSLVHASPQLPADLSDINPRTLIQGYVCNLIETGCFVRFLGRLTAFSPRGKAIDETSVNLSEAFYIGQSVRANVLDVDGDARRITVSLKQSSCSSTDASFMESFFLTEEKIADFQASGSSNSEIKCPEIGSIIECKVHETEKFGIIVHLKNYAHVVGFISQAQLGGRTLEAGTTVQAVVLDISRSENLVDLSLKPEFADRSRGISGTSASKKKRRRETNKELKVHATVNAIVEFVKDDYLVLSLPEHDYALGYASVIDYNTQKLPRKRFMNGESVTATVMALPSASATGRLLLLLESLRQTSDTSSSKRAKKKSGCDVGSLVQAEVTEVKPLEIALKFGTSFRGRVHITEVSDDIAIENPFSSYKVGQTLTARIVGKPAESESKRKGHCWELSIKPSMISGSDDSLDLSVAEMLGYSIGQLISGYVSKVDNDWIWLAVSRDVNAQLFILDSAHEISELKNFQKRFKVGEFVSGYIVGVNKEKKLLRLTLSPFSDVSDGKQGEYVKKQEIRSDILAEKGASHIREGDVLGGRIWKVLPGVSGLLVQIGPHLYGKVHYTEITDNGVDEPLSSYIEGQFVKCIVLEVSQSVSGGVHVDLSLRSTLVEVQGHNSDRRSSKGAPGNFHADKIEDLHPNMVVQGYVKSVTSKGCFIMLSRNVDAKVLLSNLSNGFVKDPQKEFPIGKLVSGKVLTVDPSTKRVEVTLKSSNDSGKSKVDLDQLQVGGVVSGKIKRVEPYGLFITIENSNLVGLCHVSEISDDPVEDVESSYKAGERVTAKLLKVDKERHRISLGMKASYIEDDSSTQLKSLEFNETTNDNDSAEEDDFPCVSDSDDDCETNISALIPAESKSVIPALDVTLDDIDDPIADVVKVDAQDDGDEMGALDEKSKKLVKRKAKVEKEEEIRVAEQRLLEGGAPETADEYEKLVRSSPDSSFIWIKYMEFKLKLADVEGARSIAEKALKTINIRNEAEKQNIWVAFLNLENEYGNPREQSVMKVFNRAIQQCDPLKLHLELLGLYERTDQNQLADELLQKMMKKFKDSTEVWLRRIQWLLKQNQDGVERVTTRALLSLPKHERTHVNFLSQVAIVQFKSGSADKGRSLFEKILQDYPKRTDLWSVYIDQEIRTGDQDLIRALFERATSLSLHAKKMKFLFKKYRDYEKSHGDEERVQYVVQKVKEYVESTMTA
ncbi:hypothetical protein V2J09_020301 [Rumex salicifolius]